MAAIWFDQVDNVRWSPLMIENIIEEIGYEMSGRIKVHYSVPHLTISRSGLREETSEAGTQVMLEFVGSGYYFLKLSLNHNDSLMVRYWEALRGS
jgi:hypothetical protein